MTGRDAARDELLSAVHEGHLAWIKARNEDSIGLDEWIAAHLLARGYRRSVTPQQIEAAAKALSDDHHGEYEFDEILNERVPTWRQANSHLVRIWTKHAQVAARAFGLEVGE